MARVRGVHAEGGVELLEGLVVHAVYAEGLAGYEADVPVVAGSLEEVFDAVAGGFFFAAGEKHVDAVEVGFDGAGVEGESFVEGAAGFEDVHLAAEAMAGVLEMSDAEAGPGGRILLVLVDDGGEELAGAIEVFAAAGAGHERGEDGSGLEVLLGEGLVERDSGGDGAVIFVVSLEIAEALEGGEDFVADFGLNADKVEGGYVDGAARADALAGDIEELPVEIEAFF